MPPYSEDGEPPFLREWIEADESLHVLAYSCISMLAASHHLYLKTFEKLLHFHLDDSLKPKFKKSWLSGYRAYFAHHLGIRFEDCPANLEVLEEVVLARNRVQHPESIAGHRTPYSSSDLGKLAYPFFVNERERDLLADVDEAESAWFMPPTIHVSAEKLATAIEQVEKFGDWLENEIDSRVYGQ
ncbi:hypothetical protein [Polaromonas jejuensis]|uniref:HEPN AbiU2-like domain-containing protein n=1 Tax=Polaromonas jejuensis TaxID=457502 RepID=A0ABW0QAK8_9BURK|nr:hypothetical protein [Polaromonas jejuensis]